MPAAHRNGDSRSCGATTVASQSTVLVNGKAWAVDGDSNSHGGGSLTSSISNVLIGGKPVCVSGDVGAVDSLYDPLTAPQHITTNATNGSPNVFVGG